MNQEQITALLQLSSPALPIGGFSYSQGFEAAVDCGLIFDESSAQEWISQILTGSFAHCDAIVWIFLYQSWSDHKFKDVHYWNQWYMASRETHEFRLETQQMGWSLVKLSKDLSWGDPKIIKVLETIELITLPCAHSAVSHSLDLPIDSALTAYGFTWLENQVMAAIKTIPLGQSAGQRIINKLRSELALIVLDLMTKVKAGGLQINTAAHQISILSSRHETQYSRLFRS
jgi:urease accessory protein